MLSGSDLRALHQNLSQGFGSILERGVKLVPDAKREQLIKLRSGGIMPFELAPTDRCFERALSRRREYVFPLVPMTYDSEEYGVGRCWVAWFESWRCIDTDEFDLQAAAWTLYWGCIGDEMKTRVLRAEWDQLYRLDCTRSNAGHPHWHIDTEVPLSQTTLSPAGLALEPVDESPFSCLVIERLHLAMGGWLNRRSPHPASSRADNEVPECWQHAFGGSADDLIAWGVRTLRYLQTQSDYIRIT